MTKATNDKKKRNKVLIIILVACFIIAGVVAGINLSSDASASQKEPVLEEGQIEIVNEEGEIEVVDEDSEAAKEYEQAVSNGERDSVKTVQKSSTTSKTSTSSAKKETTSSNSSSSSKDKNSSSSSSSTSKDSTTSTTHTHSWTAVYKEVDNGYYETRTKKIAWTECHICGADISGKAVSHMEAHMDNGEGGSYGTSYRYETYDVWVSVIEKVVDYYKCSSCGATK